eukprot:1978169-Heterocapsa_arctica.AAC.1
MKELYDSRERSAINVASHGLAIATADERIDSLMAKAKQDADKLETQRLQNTQEISFLHEAARLM